MESKEAQCGPPLFFLGRWNSRTGITAPLKHYKPLYKYYDQADHYWNESWDSGSIDPFPAEDKRGFLFVQSETLIPLDELYRGEWIGYEDL